jgi:hypothetical protein
MTTAVQVTTNRQNALASTGPRTAIGKARSARNDLRSGLRSDVPVLPGEDAAAWETHRAEITAGLAPAGRLESELAGRVALCLWRLRRLAAYETAVTTAGLEQLDDDPPSGGKSLLDSEPSDADRLAKLQEELQKKREAVELWEGTLRLLERLPELADDAVLDGDDVYGVFEELAGSLPENAELPEYDSKPFLTELGVPAEECGQPFEWDGWTAGLVRRGLAQIAKVGRVNPKKLLARAVAERRETQAANRAEAAKLDREVRALRGRMRRTIDRQRQRRVLPDSSALDNVMRYEAHLSRQMLQALHTLERLQAARAGQPVLPPAALDVTLEGPSEPAVASVQALAEGA